MARVNVYLPDDLAEEARASGINVSQVTQQALRAALAGSRTNAWLAKVRKLPPTGITTAEVVEAVNQVRDEMERGRA
ncbi:MAG: type II toxin-antitoxin system CcdA family antitoxin [Actinomycetota bacterium]